MEIKYIFKEKKGEDKPYSYHFEIVTDTLVYLIGEEPYKRILYFYTYSDLSGFKPNCDITDPRELITLGQEILFNMDYIKNKVMEESKTKNLKNLKGGVKMGKCKYCGWEIKRVGALCPDGVKCHKLCLERITDRARRFKEMEEED